IVQHCLEKDPEQRFQSARDIAFDLETLTGSTAGRAPAILPMTRGKLSPWLILPAALLIAAAAFLAGRRTARPAGGEAGGAVMTRFTKLTEEGGVEHFPSLSPDGKSIVYVSAADGDQDIYLRRVGGYNPINLTADSPGEDTAPVFSRDGQRIAYSSGRGGIFTMGATGESARRISETGSNPTWSPDGREIAVASEPVRHPLARSSTLNQLLVLDAATGARRSIPTGDAVQPAWSPHGHRIAYWGLREGKAGQRDIWTVGSRGGSAPVSVTDDVFVDWSPTWSPDGRYLYFSSDRGGTMNLWRFAIDEETGKVSGSPEAITTPTTWSGQYSFSADGRQLVFQSVNYRTEMARMGFDAVAGRVTGSPEPVLRGSREMLTIDLSPDGEWLAIQQRAAREDIIVVRTDGSSLRQLTDDPFRDRGPEWSPAGDQIAFYSNRTGRYEIWVIRPDGSGLEQITASDFANIWYPHWSPDGARLGVSGPSGSYLLTLSGGRPARNLEALPVVSPEETFRITGWSPDGTKLVGRVATARDAQQREAAIYSPATRQYERLPRTEVAPVLQSFRSPKFLDGSRLIYETDMGVAVYEISSRKSRTILTTPPGTAIQEVIVSRDGKWLYLLRNTDEGDIWQMEMQAPSARVVGGGS
ncbi:MAG TPA: hypothetical protein VNC59_08125, partial [Thermoanaerobaculia bacterium]|nr:hypothetical protein [Thermoanaerobaculia bacterium]